ncbi:MAG: NAD(P)/FAD-dependent oxidoreductase [Thermodesulfobacteriota bacterium]
MDFHTVIVGGGPGGLACSKMLAEAGIKVLILEAREQIGDKVCAGGITWDGLIKRVDDSLVEQSFPKQYLRTPLQSFSIKAEQPIIATVNRIRLGRQMAADAQKSGVQILTGCRVTKVDTNTLTFHEKNSGRKRTVTWQHLVGADGSTSMVRTFLGLRISDYGIGINYQVPIVRKKMEWHLDHKLFHSGYAWVFPHRETTSVGAYVDHRLMKATDLQHNLKQWAKDLDIPLNGCRPRAQKINYDYCGFHFDNIFLIGDAAGLASPLTGEGIFPAIISGEEAAKAIIDPGYESMVIRDLAKKHLLHRRMVTLSGKSRIFSFLLAELVGFGLRLRIIPFRALEMVT